MNMNTQLLIGGPVFAQLLHDQSVSPNNQEGLLIGDSEVRLTNQIDDHTADNEREDSILKICSFIPCRAYDFYDYSLNIDQKKLDDLLGKENHDRLIGYYSFRRNLPLELSFRERVISLKLAQQMKGIPFVIGLFTTAHNGNFSIHSMEHLFLDVRPRNQFNRVDNFQPVSFRIMNLGEDARQHYRNTSSSSVSTNTGKFSQVLSTINYPDDNDHEVKIVKSLHQHIQNQLDQLGRKITETIQTIEGADNFQ